ncbi:MAG: hypothetical protein IJQ59_08565 [Bacteroidaceae bacterium]|nr:hypothetical protein [Bacteroidaceae bacterium]
MAKRSIIKLLEKGDVAKDLKVAYSFMLLSKGYSAQELKILDDYDFSIRKKASRETESLTQEEASIHRRRKQRSLPKNLVCLTSSSETYNNRDHTLYTFNGDGPLTKGRLVLSIIKLYQEDFSPTFEEVSHLINQDLGFPQNTIIEKLSLEALRPDRQKRFYYHQSDMIESKDGILYAVSNQWSVDKMDRIISFARSLGWTVEVIQPTK